MTERKVKPAEEDEATPIISKNTGDRIIVDAKIGDMERKQEPNPDPFNKVLKGYAGLDASSKRAITRKSNKIEKTYKGQEGTGTQQIEEQATGYNYLDVVQPEYNLDWLAKLPAISEPHLAAIRAKEANIIGLGFKLVESPKTKRKLNSLKTESKVSKFRQNLQQASDEINEYIDELNDDDSFTDTLSKMWFDYEATGQGYLEFSRKSNGMIGYIGHIPSTTMRVRRKRDGYAQIISNKVVFFRNFGDKSTPNPYNNEDSTPNEVMMFKKYSPTDSFYGMPDIMAAANALAGNEFAEKFNLDYFENKAVPRHVIILKGAEFSAAAERSIVSFFETGLRGQNHRSLYVPLPGDRPDEKVELKIEPVETGVQDQSFDKYRKSNISSILLAHRVPPNKIGLTEGMSVATALDASKTFKEQVCTPQQNFLSKKLNKIIKELTEVFVIEFNELTLTDEDTQSKIDERYLRMKTIVPNEVRARMGLPGIPGGDKPVDLKPQQASDLKADAGKTRQEDADRSAASSTTSSDGRNAKGEGRRS